MRVIEAPETIADTIDEIIPGKYVAESAQKLSLEANIVDRFVDSQYNSILRL